MGIIDPQTNNQLNMKISIIFMILLLNAFTMSFAGTSPHKLEMSFVREVYPSSKGARLSNGDLLFKNGEDRHSEGIVVGYSYDQVTNREWGDLSSYYILVDTQWKYEFEAELYDSDRIEISTDTKFKFLAPIIQNESNFAISAISGLDIQLNGPQINDNHLVGHIGIQFEQLIPGDFGRFSLIFSAESARYFYELDDESILEQTNLDREFADHVGNGNLFTAEIKFNNTENIVKMSLSKLKANDERQKLSNYTKNIYQISWLKNLSNTTDCGAEFSTVSHDYLPAALVFDDELFTVKILCFKKF